ncbi:acetolactate synthase small subunit [Galbibacter sp. EGI 63066]|uniref:acetolactate synthase small subunit n=1 Tax=Galbibacter sp. EGI 63066 TaxID=2993559 RepID=UPI002248BDD4|nr:acetolactate synthase small subunit [Galbibacter sp. EGI 63066]MCX2680836.1 acetolactate synthase small subunit [Galbibacter sp. EGI 63066]
MEGNKTFTISVYSENNVGLLNRISGIFLKRHINIESLNVSKSEIDNVSKFTIVIYSTEDWARKIVGQIEKQIEVIKAYYHTDEETIFLETGLFKIASRLLFDERQIQNIIKDNHSEIVTVSPEFFVISKSGRREEIEEMYEQLKPYGIMQFVRSGRISVSKSEMQISNILKEFQLY